MPNGTDDRIHRGEISQEVVAGSTRITWPPDPAQPSMPRTEKDRLRGYLRMRGISPAGEQLEEILEAVLRDERAAGRAEGRLPFEALRGEVDNAVVTIDDCSDGELFCRACAAHSIYVTRQLKKLLDEVQS